MILVKRSNYSCLEGSVGPDKDIKEMQLHCKILTDDLIYSFNTPTNSQNQSFAMYLIRIARESTLRSLKEIHKNRCFF